LKSTGNADVQKVTAIAAKAGNSGVLVSALITSAATAKHKRDDAHSIRRSPVVELRLRDL
jgi:hypothetical protein